MFSRSTAPEHCTSGRDSMGRQLRFSLISRSACAGTSSPGPAGSACAGPGGFTGPIWGRRAALSIRLVRGVIGLDLLVEATGHGGGFVHGSIVLLLPDLLQIVLGLFLLGVIQL